MTSPSVPFEVTSSDKTADAGTNRAIHLCTLLRELLTGEYGLVSNPRAALLNIARTAETTVRMEDTEFFQFLDDFRTLARHILKMNFRPAIHKEEIPNLDMTQRLVGAYLAKTAGEIKFIKDREDNLSSWAWDSPGVNQRTITPDFSFDPENSKQLLQVLEFTLMALGHSMSAYDLFTKLNSSEISPDGALGGRGYVQTIKDMRRNYMNVVEALSAASDTLGDELHAPHWSAVSRQTDPQQRSDIENSLLQAEDIAEDPEGWAQEEMEEVQEGHHPDDTSRSLRASFHRLSSDFFMRVFGGVIEKLEAMPTTSRDHDWHGVRSYIGNARKWILDAEKAGKNKNTRGVYFGLRTNARKVLTLAAAICLRKSNEDETAPEVWGSILGDINWIQHFLGDTTHEER